MDWQTVIALGIVAVTLVIFMVCSFRPRKNGGCGRNCGCGKKPL